MLSLEQMRELLQDRNLMQVSRLSGVGYSTLHKIRQGNGDKVRHSLVVKLADYLGKQNNSNFL